MPKVCVFHPPPTPWPPSIRHNTLRLESSVGRYDVRDHDWVLQPLTYAITPDHNIQVMITVNVHDSVPPGILRDGTVMEFQIMTVFPDCHGIQEVSAFYTVSTHTAGGPSLVISAPPYGPEAYLHGNPFWPPHAALDEGTWATWITSEVHSLFAVNTDLDWYPAAIIQVYPRDIPRLITVPNPKKPVEGSVIYDTAVLSGCLRPTGTVTFKLVDDGNTVRATTVESVFGNGTYYSAPFTLPSTLTGSGDWHWEVKYSGDKNNPAVEADHEPFHWGQIHQHLASSDRWDLKDSAVPAIPFDPGIARFQHDTPDVEKWFERTTP